jgi:hypothetical protein
MTSRGRGQLVPKGKDKWLVRIYQGRNEDGRKKYVSKVVHGKKSIALRYLTAKQREKT